MNYSIFINKWVVYLVTKNNINQNIIHINIQKYVQEEIHIKYTVKKVYWRGNIVDGANGNKFLNLTNGYGKDDNHIFYRGFIKE